MSARIEVLLASYNGAPWIGEQVESILAQSGVNIRLTVRDDGSTDRTREALDPYREDPRVAVRAGDNLGVPAVFFRLLDESSPDEDYWALSDQDDVWRPEKLARAVAALSALEGPLLYCARVSVTNARLQPLYPHELPRRGPSFANALVQNIALGCTVVINRAARELLVGRWPAECVMHDAWMYLVIAGCGCVVYDDQVVVDYRQHGENAVGMGRGPLSRLRGRVRRQLTPGGPGRHGRQNRELLRLYKDDLRPEARRQLLELLDAQAALASRIRYAVTGAAHRQTRGSDVVLKGLQILRRV